MPEYDIGFSPSSSREGGCYKLVELPLDLVSLFEHALKGELESPQFTIKGQPNEDAVLCTTDKTYGMRSIGLSNSVLVVSPVPDEHALEFATDTIVIRDQLNEIIELTPVVPKLHKLSTLIRNRVYDENQEDETDNDEHAVGRLQQTRFTYQDARNEIQASDAEIDKGLKERRVLVLDSELRPIALPYLNRLLELILNLLVSLSIKHTSASVEELSSALADDHEVPRSVSTQVMSWFGEIKEGRWRMDIEAIVKEMGLGILRGHRHEGIEKVDLFTQWKTSVGDTFESSTSLNLLSGNYLEVDSFGSESLKYFPASALPVDPAARFSDLFLTRSRWKGDDIAPFLSDIAVNSKERDKLLLKYCRTVNDGQGIRYTARAQYNG